MIESVLQLQAIKNATSTNIEKQRSRLKVVFEREGLLKVEVKQVLEEFL